MVSSKTVKCGGVAVRTVSEAGSGRHAGSRFSVGDSMTDHGRRGLVSRRATAWLAMVARFAVLDSGFSVLGFGSGFWVLGSPFWRFL